MKRDEPSKTSDNPILKEYAAALLREQAKGAQREAVDDASVAVQNLIDREHRNGRRATAHQIREALRELYTAPRAFVPDGWYFASGPEGYFFAQTSSDANKLIEKTGFDREEWTVTHCAAPSDGGE